MAAAALASAAPAVKGKPKYPVGTRANNLLCACVVKVPRTSLRSSFCRMARVLLFILLTSLWSDVGSAGGSDTDSFVHQQRDMSAWLPVSGRVENELALLSPHLYVGAPAVIEGLAGRWKNFNNGSPYFGGSASSSSFGASGYALSAFPLTVADGGFVTVTYTVLTPKSGDWLALYLNGTKAGPLSATSTPLKFAFIDDAAYLASGNGSRTLQLINMRASDGFAFALLSGGLGAGATVAAVSTPAVMVSKDVNAPQRPRVTPASIDGSALRIAWSSGRDASSLPVFRWGIAGPFGPFPFNSSTPISSASLERSTLCGSPANTTGWHDLGFLHSGVINMTKMSPRPLRIWYQYGDVVSGFFGGSDANNTSGITLAVPAAAGSATAYPATLAAFDDLGRGSFDDAYTWGEYGKQAQNTSRALGALLDANPSAFNIVWHVGDLSYSTGYLAVAEWYTFMINTWASRSVYVIGLGNHESGQNWAEGAIGPSAANHFSLFDTNDGGGECGLVSNHIIPLPAGATVNAPWSIFSSGPFALVTLSTEHNFSKGSAQWTWLNQTLASMNRTATPWVLLGAHRPMYVDSNYVQDSAAQRGRGPSTADIPVMTSLQENVEPLTMRYKVSAAFYGHNHAVQRLTPAFQNKSTQSSTASVRTDGTAMRLFNRPTATLHLVIGTGGAGFTPNCATAVGGTVPSFSERCFFLWGFLLITAQSPTVLDLDWRDSSSGIIQERITLIQDLVQPWADEATAAVFTSLPTHWGVIAAFIAFGVTGSLVVGIAAGFCFQ